MPHRVQQGDRQLIIRFTIDPFKKSYLLLLAEEHQLSPQVSLELLGLSKREAEVLIGVVQGQDNKAIAQHLKITVSTARKHLENIYRKLNVQSRSEATALVVKQLGNLYPFPISEPGKRASHKPAQTAQRNA
ncbi:MAG: helix-turn-helix transcriptional regulator [Synechococcales cyanobacterium CRU_2_2]|nr:helix-turn-helix transcriptional regulator [Synechococcales cyanobacterium CRU_2_2]